MTREAGIPGTAQSDSARRFELELPEALVSAVELRNELRFDAVVVDEGQDFRDNWLTALRLCLRDSDRGLFYVFYDDNQKVYRHTGGWLDELPQSRYHLTKNLRNTKSIHLCAKPWYRGRVTRSAGPEGVPVEWVTVKRRGDVVAAVKGALSTLIGKKVAPGDIAILTGARVDGHPLPSKGMIGSVPFTPAGAGADGQLVFDTVRRFKGLDRPIVLLIDIEELSEPELVYVGLSRPSILLMVFGTDSALRRLKEGPGENDE